MTVLGHNHFDYPLIDPDFPEHPLNNFPGEPVENFLQVIKDEVLCS